MQGNEKTTEDYLEAMLMIKEKKGYITMDADNLITITEAGMKIAAGTYERHKLLTKIFTMLGVDEKTAKEDACRVEHDLSPETYQAIADYIKKCEKTAK